MTAPYIYLPTSSEEPRYLSIHKSIFEDRKEILSQRVEAMIAYASDKVKCREDIILEYFGESRKESCGRCDACREKRKKSAGKNRKEEVIIPEVIDFIKARPHGADFRIIAHKLPYAHEVLSKVLSFLVAEDFITFNNGAYHYKA